MKNTSHSLDGVEKLLHKESEQHFGGGFGIRAGSYELLDRIYSTLSDFAAVQINA